MEHKKTTPPSVAKTAVPTIDESAQAQPDRAPRQYAISAGMVFDGTLAGDALRPSQPYDFSFGVFPAGENKRAITAFRMDKGHYQVELLAGRSYDLCWGGDPLPVCYVGTGRRRTRVLNCPSTSFECSCRDADLTRLAWRQGCERIRVDSVTRVFASVVMGALSRIAFRCEPADACAKTDVIPDELR